MVTTDKAIEELNSNKIDFVYNDDSVCTTQGEVVIMLKNLREYEKIGLEPDEIRRIVDNWLAIVGDEYD